MSRKHRKQKRGNLAVRFGGNPMPPGAMGHGRAGAIHQVVTKTWCAPYPSPEAIAEYEKIIPGSGERFLRHLEVQGEHRMKMESDVIRAKISAEHRGQWFGLVLSLAALAVAGILAKEGTIGAGIAASVLGTGGLASIAVSFLRDRPRSEKKNDEKKR